MTENKLIVSFVYEKYIPSKVSKQVLSVLTQINDLKQLHDFNERKCCFMLHLWHQS